jgi:hypothetical protein
MVSKWGGFEEKGAFFHSHQSNGMCPKDSMFLLQGLHWKISYSTEQKTVNPLWCVFSCFSREKFLSTTCSESAI